MASSSSQTLRTYDVFLSFCGLDTRKTFISFLYKALSNRGILTFKDDRRIEKGDSITDEICRAIRSSRFAVVVISKNYASSRWCLDELQLIMELQLELKLIVLPIFYGVEPSEVRDQRGCFAGSFQKHENAANDSNWITKAFTRLLGKNKTPEQTNKVLGWREACIRVADLSGVESNKCVDEAALIDDIIEDISNRLPSTQPLDFRNIVGLTNYIEKLSPEFEMDDVNVRMIGIWGMGGIGKTTIAKYLYEKHKLRFAPHYCFMENVAKLTGERGLLYLQEQLLSDIFRQKNMKLESVERGRQQLEHRLRLLKVFLVLDGVDHVSQVGAVAKNTSWFGLGSRIIITTRDRGLLKAWGVKNIHEVKCLNDIDSLQMFKQIAFEGQSPPSDGHNKLSVRASQLVQGLPFAIDAFASYLRGKTTIEEWESSLTRLERYPPTDIMKVLKLGYDGLEEPDKNVFLHVVFLFIGSTVRRVTTLLDDDESVTKDALTNLVDKSLISVSTHGCISMHVLIEQMGIEVVRLSEREPRRRRFLRDPQEIHNVLSLETWSQGTEQIQCLTFHTCERPTTNRTSGLKSMHNLKFLKFYKHLDSRRNSLEESYDPYLPDELRLLHWDSYPFNKLYFRNYGIQSQLQCLVEVNLRYSRLKCLSLRGYTKLRILDLTGSWDLREILDLSTSENLEELILKDCTEIETSIFCIPRLKKLNARLLSRISIRITDLQDGSLNRGRQIRLTHSGGNESLNHLTDLSIECNIDIDLLGLKGGVHFLSFSSNTRIHDEKVTMGQETETPDHVISEAHGLKSLIIKNSWYNKSFGCSSFSKFVCLVELSLVNLRILEIPEDIGDLQSLEKLDLSGNHFEYLPTTMEKQGKLKYLCLLKCGKLKSLPRLSQVERLTLLDCLNLQSLIQVPIVEKNTTIYHMLELCLDNCKNATSLSYELTHLTNLTYLDLSSHDFETLPSSIQDLSSLVTLCLKNCKKLTSITVLPLSLKSLLAHGCRRLNHVSLSSKHSIKHLDLGHCFDLSQNEEVMARFLDNQSSEEVTSRFACLPATRVPSFCTEQSLGASLTVRSSSTFTGFHVYIMIASKIHLQFPTFSYTWNWETHDKFRLILKPDLYHPYEDASDHMYEEYATPTRQLVIILFPSCVNNEFIHDLQFEASLELFKENHAPKAEITSCGICMITT